MEHLEKFPVIAPLFIAGLLSACAAPSQSVITRAWQVDYTLTGVDRECRFNAISRAATEEINERIDADQVFEELSQACPELMLASTANKSGERIFITEGNRVFAASSTATVFGSGSERSASSGRSSNDRSRSSAGDSTGPAGGDAGSSSGGDTGGNAGSGSGNDTSGDTGNDAGNDEGSGAGGGTGGDTGGGSTGDTSGKGGGKGSNANNGGGNGSEGASPGRGKGANQDE